MSNTAAAHRGHLACLLALLAAACGPSDNREVALDDTGFVNGQLKTVRVDPNQAGQSSSLRVEEVFVGRLVDVFDSEDRDCDPNTAEVRTLQAQDFLIGESVVEDGVSYLLRTNPINQRTELTILADADGDYAPNCETTLDPDTGQAILQRKKFRQLFDAIATTAQQLPATAIGTSSPPFPMVPRNGAISVRFSDLLDQTRINGQTVRLTLGSPPVSPFEARVIPDPNHGAFLNGVFATTRVIVDTTISESEAAGTTLPLNQAGLPPGESVSILNASIRIPTRLNPSVGQFQLLRNLSGTPVQFANNGPIQNNATSDVVRGFRTGGAPGDPFNGYLRDDEPPRLRGVQAVAIPTTPQTVAPDASLGEIATGNEPDRVFLATIDFATNVCAVTPDVGDLLVVTGIDIPEVYAEVTRKSAPPQSGTASDVRVRLLRFPVGEDYDDLETEFLMAGSGQFEATFRPGAGVVPECFLQISPPPGAPPTSMVSTRPRISVRFTEPMDPRSIRPFDNIRMDRDAADPPKPDRIVVGEVTPAPDLREFRYVPVISLDHTQASPSGDTYFFNLIGGATGVTDLAGNALVDSLPADVPVTVNPSEPDSPAGGLVLRFGAINEFGLTSGGVPTPELRGQFLRDLAEGTIRARSVDRFSQVVDQASAPNFNLLPLFIAVPPPPLDVTPLNHRGSRLMTAWRYGEVGLELFDENTMNVDVEGLSWEPTTGQVATEFFSQFEISLSHSSRLPDDAATPTAGGGYINIPLFPNSGLLKKFVDNVLVDPVNEKKVVHPRSRGYLVDPMQVFTASSGTTMMPYPLNRGLAPKDSTFYTWRDTAIIGTGGPEGRGAPVQGHIQTSLFGITTGPCLDETLIDVMNLTLQPPEYAPGAVRSLALPLLLEFKCFPDNGGGGLNTPTTVHMLGSNFRAYSSGSPTVTSPITKNPDAELNATGTLNQDPNALDLAGMAIPMGTPLPGTDAVAYSGQLDLVVRVSRVHTRWFDTKSPALGFPLYGAPILEPRPDEQPSGTNVMLAFRGADTVSGMDFENASMYDEYGDPLVRAILASDGGTPCVPGDDMVNMVSAVISASFTNGDTSWKSDITEINGSKFFQVRITFISNTGTSQVPRLSTLAIPFERG